MKVILLNQDYSYINSISVRRALRLITKGKVSVEKYSERIVRTVTKDIAVPLILRLVYLVRRIYRKAVTWSKKNVMVPDNDQKSRGVRSRVCKAPRSRHHQAQRLA